MNRFQVAQFTTLTDRAGTALEASGGIEGNFFTLLGSLIGILVAVTGVILLVFIVIGGFYWMTAGGNTEQVAKAKRILVNSVVGIVIILISYSVAAFVQTAVIDRLRGGSPDCTVEGLTTDVDICP